MTEEELIKGCIKKNNNSQRLLFEMYAGKMMSVCMRYTNDHHIAQDILQMGFIKVFDYIHQFRFEGSFEGWMKRIFVTIAIRELSKKKITYLEITNYEESVLYEDPSAVSKISENELHALIRLMPDGYRTIFNLVVIEGYTHDEIAGMLKIKPATSRTQLLKARKHLQALISKSFKIVLV